MVKLRRIVLACFCSFQAIAQVNSVMNNASGTFNSIQLNVLSTSNYDVLSGSAYINPNFQEGKVMISSNPEKWADAYFLRLNTYTKLLEFKENEIIKAATPSQVRAFTIGDKLYKSGFVPIEKQSSSSYYQVLYEGKYKILKFTNTVLEAVISADDVKQGDKFTTYDYYYLLDNEKYTRFFPTKKSILKLVSTENTHKFESFIVEKNLKFKEDKEIASLGIFLDSLK